MEADRRAVEKIVNSKTPIDRSMLLKEQQKSVSRKMTKMSLRLRELGISPSINELDNSFVDNSQPRDASGQVIDKRIIMAMKQKNLKFYDLPSGPMTDFQREIIFIRVLEKEPMTTYEGIWRDWAQCHICEKWQRISIEFNASDDTFFEDFCREIMHKRKKLQYKEVENRVKVIAAEEEKKKKEVVLSKGPLRRLKSEIPSLDLIKKRHNSTMLNIPMFTNMMKSESTKEEEKVVEIKSVIKAFHPQINPVTFATEKIVNGK